MISENEEPLITKKVIFIIIGCIATILTFITMIMPFTESKAKTLSPAYKVVTVYCLNSNCEKDGAIDSKLENTLNKMRRETLYFQGIISIVPIIGYSFGTNNNTSGYTIIIEYLE